MRTPSSTLSRPVLLIDEDVAELESWAVLLANAGVRVSVAPSLAAAQRLIKRESFGLLVVGAPLAGGDALDVVRQLRETGFRLPFVLVGEPPVAAAAAARLGACAVLEPPVSRDAFLSVVLRQIGVRSAGRY